MWLIVWQLSIKAEWQDAPLAIQDFIWSNKKKLLANVAIGLHWHPHLHQSVLAILSCGVKLIYSSQFFSSSNTKCFFCRDFFLKKFPFACDDVKENDAFRSLNKFFFTWSLRWAFNKKKWMHFSNETIFLYFLL